MKRKLSRFLVNIVCILVSLMQILPVMSTYLSDGESCTLIIRGYNLMEFSTWGFFPLFAPLLFLVILFGRQEESVKEIELVILFVSNMFCYIHSFNAARSWLYSLSCSLTTFHPGALLIPFVFVMIFAFAKIFELFTHQNSLCTQD